MDQATWNAIINGLVTLVLALLVPLVAKGIQYLLVKINLDKSIAIQTAVRSGIAYAEEAAATAIKRNLTPMNPGQKLETAISQVVAKVPGVTRDEAAVLVHQQLPQVGLGAAGFLQGLATAVQTPPAK